MGIKTYSAFNYGHTIDDDNNLIDFNEGALDLVGEIEIGSYSLGEFVDAVSIALNNAGTQEYTVSIDRATRLISISASSNFSLLPVTGVNSVISAFPLMGFTIDKTLSNSYIGDESSGSYFEPQNILQKFVDYNNNVKTTGSSVNKTADGRVEVVSYGQVEFMSCNITPITDISPQLSIKNNINAVSEFRSFMNYCITKAPIEFIEDINSPLVFKKTLLESTKESKDGVDFKIKELFSKKLFGYYESGGLVFRALE